MTCRTTLSALVMCTVIVSSTPSDAEGFRADFDDIPAGTSYTSAGTEFFSGGIRFETAPLNLSPSGPQVFNQVDIDLGENLGFVPYSRDNNALYPNNSSVIMDFAGSIGTLSSAVISFVEGSGIVNFDVNNTNINDVMTGTDSLQALANGPFSGVVRNGVFIQYHPNITRNHLLFLYGQIDSIFLGGQEVLIRDVWGTTGPLVVKGDLNGDNFVGIEDLNIILGAWNQNVPPGDPLADPSGDGFVGIGDLGIVLSNWNAGIPPWALPLLNVAPVPEPGTIAVLILGCAFCTRYART